MKTRKLYYRRAFLNKPRYESTGMILAEVQLRDGPDSSLDGGLTIGDCSRQVTLSFGVWPGGGKHREIDHGEIANVRHKTRLLRKTVVDFCDAVERGLVIIEDSA